MRRSAVFRSFGLAALFVFAFAALVLGYAGQVAGQIILSGPGFTIACNNNWYITAHVTEAVTGNPIEGQPVHFSITVTPDSGDSLSDSNVTTNSNGDARTTLHVTSTPGSRTIHAVADNVSGNFTVDCEAGGLPPTSVALPAAPAGPASMGFILAGFAVLSGFGILTLKFFRR